MPALIVVLAALAAVPAPAPKKPLPNTPKVLSPAKRVAPKAVAARLPEDPAQLEPFLRSAARSLETRLSRVVEPELAPPAPPPSPATPLSDALQSMLFGLTTGEDTPDAACRAVRRLAEDPSSPVSSRTRAIEAAVAAPGCLDGADRLLAAIAYDDAAEPLGEAFVRAVGLHASLHPAHARRATYDALVRRSLRANARASVANVQFALAAGVIANDDRVLRADLETRTARLVEAPATRDAAFLAVVSRVHCAPTHARDTLLPAASRLVGGFAAAHLEQLLIEGRVPTEHLRATWFDAEPVAAIATLHRASP